MPRDWTPAERAANDERRRRDERDRRQRAVESTLGSLRIEGLEIDAETRAIMDRYVDGELGIDEVMPAIRALWERDAGDAG